MAPFDRSYATFYWTAIVTIALWCTAFELFDVELWPWKKSQKVIQSGTIRKLRCGFLFAFRSN